MSSLNAIVVPLDGSNFAEQALDAATQLARSDGATLRLVMIHQPLTAWSSAGEYGDGSTALSDLTREQDLAYLEQAADQVRNATHLEVICALLEGQVATTIAGYVAATASGLVVMTSHGRGGLPRMLLGSVADELIRLLAVPLMVVRPMTTVTRVGPPRILVPLDGSSLAESVLEQARLMALHTGAGILVVSVLQPFATMVPPLIYTPGRMANLPNDQESRIRGYLESVVTRLKREGIPAAFLIHTASKVSRELLAIAQEEECSLIAIATHGLRGFDRLMIGSVADEVVRHSPISVLLQHSIERHDRAAPPWTSPVDPAGQPA